VLIPVSDVTGHRTISHNMLNAYGYSGSELDAELEPKGCPRQFKHRYVIKDAPKPDSEPMRLGRIVHAALQTMEDDAVGPEEALDKVWDPTLGPDRYLQVLTDLRTYLARESTPMDRYATWDTERRLFARLYVDEEFGEVWVQGIIDRIAVDFDNPGVVHVGDWKYVSRPPSFDDVLRSVQLKIYAWLVLNCWQELGLQRRPRVVVHLDAIKFRELTAVEYSEEDIEALEGWMRSAAHTILRDDEGEPILNWGCSYCPVQDSCPAFQALPDVGRELLTVKPEDRDERVKWRDKANAVRLLLQNAVKVVDENLKADAAKLGTLKAGGYVWSTVPDFEDITDTRQLHVLMGDPFYDAVTITKGRLEQEAAAAADPTVGAQMLACRTSRPSGTKIVKKKG
jgi:hypothetical protein